MCAAGQNTNWKKLPICPKPPSLTFLKEIYNPSISTAICKAFSITPAQFFADEGEPVALTKQQFELLLLWGSATEDQQQLILATLQNFKK